jgi:hypothetical protein
MIDDRASLLESAFTSALHFFTGAQGRWAALVERGATDDEVLERLGAEFGLGGGMVAAGRPDRFEIKGGTTPAFYWKDYRSAQDGAWNVVLSGAALARAARSALGIPEPGGGGQGRLF